MSKIDSEKLQASLHELIRRSTVHLANDAQKAIQQAYASETEGSRSREILALILENFSLAVELDQPMTPHTSSVHFFITAPEGLDRTGFQVAARAAVAQATVGGSLQQNRVDPITAKPIKTNAGPGMPHLHFDLDPSDQIEVRIVLKSNGAEGSGIQFVLPDDNIPAANDLDGIRRAILEAIILIQGRGCGPGVVGVGVGGDRASGMELAHRQLLRSIGSRNSNRVLAGLEKQLLEDVNSLGVGPLGLGGKSTALAVHIGSESTPRESCYVSISYLGWAYRRQGIVVSPEGEIDSWLYSDDNKIKTPKLEEPRRITKIGGDYEPPPVAGSDTEDGDLEATAAKKKTPAKKTKVSKKVATKKVAKKTTAKKTATKKTKG